MLLLFVPLCRLASRRLGLCAVRSSHTLFLRRMTTIPTALLALCLGTVTAWRPCWQVGMCGNAVQDPEV